MSTLEKIKTGNSFYVICTLNKTGTDENGIEIDIPVNFSEIENMEVYIYKSMDNVRTNPSYTYSANVLTMHVTPEFASQTGKYRFVVKGTYLGEQIERNPLAFQMVTNVEQEGKGCSECSEIELRRIELNESLHSGYGGTILLNNVSWGSIIGNMSDQSDLQNELNYKVDADYVEGLVGNINTALDDINGEEI